MHPEFYWDVLRKLCKIVGSDHFYGRLMKCIKRYVRRGYDPDILRCTASMVIDLSTLSHLVFPFDCATTRQPQGTQ